MFVFNKVLKYVKKKNYRLKGERNNVTIILGDVNIIFLIVVRYRRLKIRMFKMIYIENCVY